MAKLKSAAEKKSRFAMERGLGRTGALASRPDPEGSSSSSSFRIRCCRQKGRLTALVSYRHVLIQEISNS
jgi:hypothetical protein